MTHRQYEAWRWWLRLEWNRPDRSDHYAMQVCQHLWLLPARVWGKNPEPPKLDKFEIPFVFGQAQAETSVKTREELARIEESKKWVERQKMAAQVGGHVTHLTVTVDQLKEIDALPPEEAARQRRRLAEQARK